jgi:hypothetical protein
MDAYPADGRAAGPRAVLRAGTGNYHAGGRQAEQNRGERMAPEAPRSASGYEEQLRRHELAAGRALMQVLPAGEPASARQLAEARRALTRAIRELRGLRRQLELDVRRLQGGEGPARSGRPGPGRGQPAARSRPPGRQPEGLHRYEAALNAIDEVLDRWEGRRTQLAAEIERRSARS